MTRDDILKMQPGPEMDALVAEKVMGWLPHFRNTAFYVETENEGKVIDHHVCAVDMWRPSTSIADAWKVVDHLRELRQTTGGYWLSLQQIAGRDAKWRAGFTFGGMAVRHVPVYAEGYSAPEAICKAALLAVQI